MSLSRPSTIRPCIPRSRAGRRILDVGTTTRRPALGTLIDGSMIVDAQ
jgi:hypothetical protein